jgi:hypothetical protein
MLPVQGCRKREEQRKTKNLPKLGRRRWSGGGLVVEDLTSPGNIRKRSGRGGEEGEDAEHR